MLKGLETVGVTLLRNRELTGYIVDVKHFWLYMHKYKVDCSFLPVAGTYSDYNGRLVYGYLLPWQHVRDRRRFVAALVNFCAFMLVLNKNFVRLVPHAPWKDE